MTEGGGDRGRRGRREGGGDRGREEGTEGEGDRGIGGQGGGLPSSYGMTRHRYFATNSCTSSPLVLPVLIIYRMMLNKSECERTSAWRGDIDRVDRGDTIRNDAIIGNLKSHRMDILSYLMRVYMSLY